MYVCFTATCTKASLSCVIFVLKDWNPKCSIIDLHYDGRKDRQKVICSLPILFNFQCMSICILVFKSFIKEWPHMPFIILFSLQSFTSSMI